MAKEMSVTLTSNEGSESFTCIATENDLYKTIAEKVSKLSVPNHIYINTSIGNAEYNVVKRGSFIKKGIEYPSMHIIEEYNSVNLPTGTYNECYLTCVNPESNNYKFYRMTPQSFGIEVTYGRIGTKPGEMFGEKKVQDPYPLRMYWMLYFEKLSKGYVDQSDIFLNKKVSQKKTPVVTDERACSIELYRKLRKYAEKVVEEHLVSSNVTEAQVKKAKEIFKKLCCRKTINGFNKQLLELISVSPRNARYVDLLLAHDKSDFMYIIDREESLISAMEALVYIPETITNTTSFKALGISVFEATDEQRQKVIGKLSPNLQGKVKNVYRVINKKHKDRFNKYLEKEHVRHVKELWHGSRNENWLSIVKNGLQLNPDAVITGKMFGNGIYFAPSSDKSWGYTSGGYWTKEKSSDVRFMGLYATAYGHPLDVSCAGQYSQRIVKNNGKNCVHAHAGTQLRNDEIIFYAEEAMLLNYIVEFAA